MRVRLTDEDGLAEKLRKMSDIQLQKVIDRSLAQMFNRAAALTPVGDYPGGGQLRISRIIARGGSSGGEFGYVKEYGPHVEYGHRLVVNGKQVGYVKGQRYLQRNVQAQEPLYRADLRTALEGKNV